MTHGVVTCYLYDPGGHGLNGDAGNGSFVITGGRYYQDLQVIVRRPDNTTVSGEPAVRGPAVPSGSTFSCRLLVGGDLPVARGTPWATSPAPWVSGPLSNAAIEELNETGTCPCGCGGNAANSTAACNNSEGGIDYSLPIAGAPPPQAKGSPYPPKGELPRSPVGRQPRIGTNVQITPGGTRPRGSTDIHTPAFVFTGKGVIRGCH